MSSRILRATFGREAYLDVLEVFLKTEESSSLGGAERPPVQSGGTTHGGRPRLQLRVFDPARVGRLDGRMLTSFLNLSSRI